MNSNFDVLTGGKIQEEFNRTLNKKRELYKSAFVRAITKPIESEFLHKDNLKQIVYYGVKYVNSINQDKKIIVREQVENEFALIDTIKNFMRCLTLDELINIFPITKEYDGEKYYCKDYLYAVNEFKKYDYNEQIGNNLEEILWDCMNRDLFEFQANLFSTMSNIKKMNGEPSIMEEFMEKEGVETFTMNEANGISYLQSSKTGKTFPLKEKPKRKPKYLRVIC